MMKINIICFKYKKKILKNIMKDIFLHIPSSINKLHKTLIIKKAKGSWVFCSKGDKYLDLTSGIGALSTGHSHIRINEIVKKQVDKYVHIPQQVYGSHTIQIELTKNILSICPKNLDNIFYTNSGSESTDNALKISRKFTGKKNIIAMNKGFHGRSLAALSVTSSNLNCKLDTQPLIPGIFFCNSPKIEDLDLILNYQSSPNDTACIILEPVIGEGGIYSINADFLKYVRKICTDHNIVFIVDEVQCGIGRTGTWWNFEQKNIIPDMITFGKGIASGYPLAGIIGKSNIMNCGKSYLGGTYGGNAICSAAANETINIIRDENLLNNVIIMGEYFNKNIRKLKNYNKIKEIRQYGLMIAIEMINSNDIINIVQKLRDENILVLLSGNKNQYIRLLPPLNINSKELDFFLLKFDHILEE